MKNEQTRTNKRPLSLYSSHAAHLCSAQTLLCIRTRTYFHANLYQSRTKTQLFSELGINGRMWLVIKDLYTNVKAKVLYAGAVSREIYILQGTGQGRILAPFMYKVYINSLLKVLTDHCYAISINRLSLPPPRLRTVSPCLLCIHHSLKHLRIFVMRMAKHGDINLIILKVGLSHLEKQSRYILN